MVRPCAKHARQNCYAPTKNTDGKTPSDIFMPACPHPSPLGLYGLGCGSNNDSYAPTNRFWTHSCSPPLGCLLAWFYAVTEDKRSMTARFHNVADGNISRLCDSADISSSPGAHKHREDLRFRRVCGVFVIAIAPVKHLKKRQNSVQRIFLKIVLQPLDNFFRRNYNMRGSREGRLIRTT